MAEIFFAEEKNGYDKVEVDIYISKLTEAYQAAYDEYQAMSGRYNQLTQDYMKLEGEKHTGLNTDLLAKTLLDAEILAQKIVDSAHVEAAKIVDQTRRGLEHVCAALGQTMNEIHTLLAQTQPGTDSDGTQSKETPPV